MNRPSPEQLQAAIVVPCGPSRKVRQWQQIESQWEGGDHRWARAGFWCSITVGAFAAVGLVWSLMPLMGDQSPKNATAEPRENSAGVELAVPSLATEHSKAELLLADGSTATLGPGARLDAIQSTPALQRWELHGAADFSVNKKPEREFVIAAGPLLIRVIGTRFHVREASGDVDVSVTEGLVEIIFGERTFALGAGQHFSTASAKTQVGTTTTHSSAAKESVASSPAHGPMSKTPASPESVLWTRAEQARLQGNHKEAAIAFETFQRQFPTDPRARLAAFEAARLRQDVLKDPGAALELLKQNDAKADDAMAEHVLARRVQALAELGRNDECREVRRQYLGKYPQGAHRAFVENVCR